MFLEDSIHHHLEEQELFYHRQEGQSKLASQSSLPVANQIIAVGSRNTFGQDKYEDNPKKRVSSHSPLPKEIEYLKVA